MTTQKESTVRLLLILPLLMGCPTLDDSVEDRLKVLEMKTFTLEAENTEIMQLLDKTEEEHVRCAMCKAECETLKDIAREVLTVKPKAD